MGALVMVLGLGLWVPFCCSAALVAHGADAESWPGHAPHVDMYVSLAAAVVWVLVLVPFMVLLYKYPVSRRRRAARRAQTAQNGA